MKMRSRMLAVMLPLLAHGETATAEEAGLRGQLSSYFACLTPHIQQLDDGLSDAYTIARSLSGACNDEFDGVRQEVFRRLDNNAQRRMMEAKLADERLNMIASQVLVVRKADKSNSP